MPGPRICILGFLFLFLLQQTAGKQCDTEDSTPQCGENESCVQLQDKSKYGECRCLAGYEKLSPAANCTPRAPDPRQTGDSGDDDADGGSSGLHFAVAFFTTLCLLSLVIVVVYYGRKYRLLGWLRYKLNQRYANSYDDVMIGQDDE